MQTAALPRFARVGLLVSAAAVLGLAGIAWNAGGQTLRAANFVTHTHTVLGTVGSAETSLYRAEAAHLAFMISRRPDHQRERDQHVSALRLRLDEALQLTADNAHQQRRLNDLRRALGERIDLYRDTQRLIDAGQAVGVDERLDDGARMIDAIQPMITALQAEERRLLAERQDEERALSRHAAWTFAALVAAVVLLLPLVFLRLSSDLRARRAAERAVGEERRYDDLHNRALTLFNAEPERRPMLEQTLELLSDTGHFPAGVFYEVDEWSGQLRVVASRGAPADLKPLVARGDGPLGEAARSGRTHYLDALGAGDGMALETGLATLRPAGLLLCPVGHQGRQLGVLALASARRLGERERGFVERLSAQLGVALHNAAQLEGLGLLAEQLRERGEDVPRKNALLERSSRLKSEFLANMSHELRTPLNAVIGFSEILRDGLAGDLSSEQGEYIGDIYTSGRHLLALINDILDLSKIEAGQMDLELDRVEPAELVASGLAMVRERAAQHRIALRDLLPADLGALCLDARRAKQIVHNLLSNAVKFTPDGGTVTLALRAVPAQEIVAQRTGDDTRVFPPPAGAFERYLEIVVSDTGIGIDGAALRELFQPFMQADSSLSRKSQGTGLGLTMVQRLAELHGGGLMARSAPGEGSRFAVWLPWREPDSARPGAREGAAVLAAPAAAPAAEDGAGTILVIEDNPRAASLIRVQLESEGFRVEIVHSASAGWRPQRRCSRRRSCSTCCCPTWTAGTRSRISRSARRRGPSRW